MKHATHLTTVLVALSSPALAQEPPGTIDDLTVLAVTMDSATLSWTNTADPNIEALSLRFWDLGVITRDEYFLVAQAVGAPPGPVSAAQSITITGLDPATKYWFAIRAVNTAGVPGVLSNNSPSAVTLAPPAGSSGSDPLCGGSSAHGATAGAAIGLLPLALLAFRRRIP